MSVLASYSRTSHPLASVFRSMIVVDDDGMSDDGSFSAQRKVGVGKEFLGSAEIYDLPCHVQSSQF